MDNMLEQRNITSKGSILFISAKTKMAFLNRYKYATIGSPHFIFGEIDLFEMENNIKHIHILDKDGEGYGQGVVSQGTSSFLCRTAGMVLTCNLV